jgi:hypothetical protein
MWDHLFVSFRFSPRSGRPLIKQIREHPNVCCRPPSVTNSDHLSAYRPQSLWRRPDDLTRTLEDAVTERPAPPEAQQPQPLVTLEAVSVIQIAQGDQPVSTRRDLANSAGGVDDRVASRQVSVRSGTRLDERYRLAARIGEGRLGVAGGPQTRSSTAASPSRSFARSWLRAKRSCCRSAPPSGP